MNGTAAAGRPALAILPALAGLGALTVSVLVAPSISPAVAIALAVVLFTRAHRWLLQWHNLLALTILVILLLPIRRYEMPGDLPFELEPYRLLVALVAVGWLASLLVDPRVNLRRTVLDGSLALVGLAAALSIIANGHRIQEFQVSDTVLKKLTFLVSFFVVFLLIASVVRRFAQIDLLVRVLVAGGAVVAAFGLLEVQTGENAFNNLSSVLPFLSLAEVVDEGSVARGGHLRVYASAQHPIALGAMLVMLVPLAVYLGRKTRQRRWWVAAALLSLGALATLSRTSVLMLLVIGLVFLWLRPRHVKRLWPLVIPGLVMVHLALPGALGTFHELFFPPKALSPSNPMRLWGAGGLRRSARLSTKRPRRHCSARVTAPESWKGPMRTRSSSITAGSRLSSRPAPSEPLRGCSCSWASFGGLRAGPGRTMETSLGSLLFAGRLGCGVRRRNVHVRRVLVHPGDVRDVHPARVGRRDLGGRRSQRLAPQADRRPSASRARTGT